MENKNNKSLKTKLSNAFNGAKETIKNTGEAIKQGAEKIGTGLTKTAAGIVIGASLLTGCAQINDPMQYEEQPAIEQELQVFSEAGTPCDNIVNGFKFHNFFGQEPDIEYETMHEDVAKYLKVGAEFLKQELNNFEKSLDGRLQAQHYFNYPDEYDNQKFIDIAKTTVINQIEGTINGKEDFFPFIYGLATVSTDPIRDFIEDGLDNKEQRVYCCALFKFLSAHALKEGLGNSFKINTALQAEYQKMIDDTFNYAEPFLSKTKFTQLQSPINNEGANRIINIEKVTKELSDMLNENAHKVNPEITGEMLKFPFYFSAYGSALLGKHNYLVDIGYHKDKPHTPEEKYDSNWGLPEELVNHSFNYYDPADRIIKYIHSREKYRQDIINQQQETEQTM